MATIEGPTKQISERPKNIDYLVVNELEPAEFYCEFIRHDSDETKYIYQAHIDAINPSDHKRISLNNQEPPPPKGTSIINTNIISSTENVTIYRTQIRFLSVNSDAPILLVKCAIEYFPNGNLNSLRTNCSSSSTFAIIPNNTKICLDDVTTGPTEMISTFLSNDTNPIIIGFSKSEFGSTVGGLCAVVIVETVLIIIFIIYQFAKYKKSQGSKIKSVVPKSCGHTQDTEINSNTTITTPDINNDNYRAMQPFIPPNYVDHSES